MCGINGRVDRGINPNISHQINMMNQSILHRGPDEDGLHLYENRIAMGMRRLSIIDLNSGQQPIYNHAGDISIVFNGELYNFRELKAGLLQQGIEFKTQSDTEVVLKLYELHGEKCLEHLNGMFAFSIHDQKKKSIFIARDRFGEKPLHYYPGNDRFVWASELKSIIEILPELKEISAEALNNYFVLTYIPAPLTIYKQVFKLLPAHYLTINTETLAFEKLPYWRVDPETETDPAISYEAAKSEIRKLLFESVEKRMIADVPLGVFLSGGVDSTIIAAIMAKVSGKKVKTFSVGYSNKKYDESARARLVADHIGSEHYEYMLDYSELYDQIDRIVLNYDEPYADSSCIPTWFIAGKAVKEVKVALTGDGGDEVFGGYNKYLSLQYRKLYQKYLPAGLRKSVQGSSLVNNILGSGNTKSIRAKAKKFLNSLDGTVLNSHLNILAMGFQQNEAEQLLGTDAMKQYRKSVTGSLGTVDGDRESLKLLRFADMHISLEGDMLVKVDRASMLCSLECRAPFLDHTLMELTYRLPDEFLLKGSNKKRILKDTFADLLPLNFFNAPKSGFEIPIADWFRQHLRGELESLLSVKNLEQHGLLNISYIQNLIREHLSSKVDHSTKLWTLYCFQKWYNTIFLNA